MPRVEKNRDILRGEFLLTLIFEDKFLEQGDNEEELAQFLEKCADVVRQAAKERRGSKHSGSIVMASSSAPIKSSVAKPQLLIIDDPGSE